MYPEPVTNPTFCPRSKEQHTIWNWFRKQATQFTGFKVPPRWQSWMTLISFVRLCPNIYIQFAKEGLNCFSDFELKFSKEPWYIGKKMAVIKTRLAQVKPPYEITRMIESFDDFPSWKASMYRTFGLFYFVILEDILPKKYFDHW